MLTILQVTTTTTTTPPDQTIQTVLGFTGILLSGSSVIGIAINRIFDIKNAKIIVELQGKIRTLEREIEYRETNLRKIETENINLKEKLTTLQEQSNSSINNQIAELQEKNQKLNLEYKKAIAVINKFKKSVKHHPDQ